MYEVIIKGEAKTDYPNLKELDGVSCEDCFSEYFDGDESYKEDVSGGYMDFRYKDGKLYTYTTYQSKRLLTKVEEAKLIDYTTGQWSDGIGEGFEQSPCYYGDDEEEVFISPWHRKQEAICIQKEIINQD